ncbi:ATP-binding cassette domain-containing protein, partial [Halomonas elongata]|uniref:ATP-binding cassette domain-containing protein n=1 Tax=Halomonas elongata TaxID=2746 RepID=UPI00255AC4BC
MATLRLNALSKTYPNGFNALHGIDLAIDDGELIVVVGPSGCGKSTLLRMLAGLESISDGELAIDGRRVNDLEPAERDIAMVFQNYALYPHMSVADNMGYALKNRGVPKAERRRKVEETARLIGLEALLDRRPRQLSGGQRQRVAMGRAIVREPKVFLFDEPLSNLDAKLRVQMRIEIRRLQKRLGVTAVYVTHDQVEAMTLADRLVVMNGGH